MPTWLGAFAKAMDGNVKNVEKGNEEQAIAFADRTVRTTQASGSVKDLAGFQRGSEAFKLFTMFYTEQSVQMNRYLKMARQFKLERNWVKLMGSVLTIWFAQALLEQLIRGRGPDDDDKLTEWTLRNEIFFPAESVIGLRDLAFPLKFFVETGQKPEFQATPSHLDIGYSVLIIGYSIFWRGSQTACLE